MRDEIRVSKIATVVLGIVAIILGYLFEQQNVAFMVGLAFAVAASCNFPVLLLSMFWSKLTTKGALIGGFLGLITAVGLVILSPTVWVKILGNAAADLPLRQPGAVLDDDRLRRHLAVLGPRPQPDRARARPRPSSRNMSARRPGSAPRAPRRTSRPPQGGVAFRFGHGITPGPFLCAARSRQHALNPNTVQLGARGCYAAGRFFRG